MTEERPESSESPNQAIKIIKMLIELGCPKVNFCWGVQLSILIDVNGIFFGAQ